MSSQAVDAGPLDVRGVPTDEFLAVEQHALDPIPLGDRHGAPAGMFLLWGAAQGNFSSIFTGALLLTLGLGIVDGALAIIVGGVLAAAVLGLLSVIGPRTGATQVVASRAVFGVRGAGIGALLTLFLGIGWFAVDSVIGTQALIALAVKSGVSDSKPLEAVLLLAIIGASMLIAVYGHQTISVFERFGTIVFLLFSALVFIMLIPKIHFDISSSLPSSAHAGSFVLGAGITFALIASWYGFTSDYSRYLSPRSSPRQVGFFSGSGIAATTILLGILGLLLLTLEPAHDTNNLQPAIVAALPGVIGIPFLIYVALGMVWGNYFDVYTAGLSSLALGLRLSRWQAALVCGALGGILAFIALFISDFATQYTNFLLITYVWAPGWAAVVLADWYVVRQRIDPVELANMRGRYWFSAGFRPAGLIAWAAGTLAAVPFINSTLWTGPLSKHLLQQADISGPVGFLVAGGVYLAIAGRRHDQEADGVVA